MRAIGVIAAVIAAAVVLGPRPATAGAFTLEPGEAKIFISGLVTSGDRYFDRDGHLQSRGRYSKYDLQAYGEYGASAGLTAFGATGLQRIEAKDGASYDHEGLGRSEIGLRARLFTTEGWIVSAQSSAILAGAKENRAIAVIGETDDQIDVRGLVARAFELFGKPAFADFGAGYRVRGGDPADEIRLDATIGVRPQPRWLLMAQSFSTIGTARWSGPYDLKQRIFKLQGSAFYDLTEKVSIFATVFFTPIGRDALEERGGSLGLSFHY